MADVVAILYVADVIATAVFSYGRCYCHSFLWQMLLPLLCILLADVIVMFLLADVIAIVCVLFGWWQMLLLLWLLFLPHVGMLYHFIADVIAILLADVIAMLLLLYCGRCCGHYG